MPSILSKINADISNKWKRLLNQDLKKADLNWWKKRSLKYKLQGAESVFILKGKRIHFKNGDELLHSLKEIFIDEIYKMKFDSPTPYILDCGANIGLSILYLKTIAPNAIIQAFEPDESNFSLLQKNVKGLQEVHVNKAAVWKNNGEIRFASTGSLSSKIANEGDANTISIPAVRLRDYLTKTVDLLKLDIEGAEYEVIKDCADKLKEVKNLFIEYHGNFDNQLQLTELFQLLTQLSFKYYIREATESYVHPFFRDRAKRQYDIQLNIFCFKINQSGQEDFRMRL